MTRSALGDDIVLAKVLRHDRAIVVIGVTLIALIGWAYLFYEGWAMQHMDLVAMAMPSTSAWGALYEKQYLHPATAARRNSLALLPRPCFFAGWCRRFPPKQKKLCFHISIPDAT